MSQTAAHGNRQFLSALFPAVSEKLFAQAGPAAEFLTGWEVAFLIIGVAAVLGLIGWISKRRNRP